MAMAFEKPLKDFLNKFQKDLAQLQNTLKKESDDLVKRVKAAAKKDNIQAKRQEIETLIEKNLKKYEPAINKFVHELNSSAKKAGVDLTAIEKKVKSNLQVARSRLSKARKAVKTTAGQGTRKATTKKKAGTTKKAGTRKKKSTTKAQSAT